MSRHCITVSGWAARPCVQKREAFTNHNGQLFGRWESPHLYVVYSHGPHWPLLIWSEDTRCWYRNAEKFSRTTTKHISQTLPLGPTHPRSCAWMKEATRKGAAFILLSHCEMEGEPE